MRIVAARVSLFAKARQDNSVSFHETVELLNSCQQNHYKL
jgi:hypothetical protein